MFFPVWVFWTKQKSGNPGSGHSKLSNVAEQCGGQSPVNVKVEPDSEMKRMGKMSVLMMYSLEAGLPYFS
jgi:hypothetical protein